MHRVVFLYYDIFLKLEQKKNLAIYRLYIYGNPCVAMRFGSPDSCHSDSHEGVPIAQMDDNGFLKYQHFMLD